MSDPHGGIARLLSVTRTVSDLDAAARFYRDALGFEPEAAPAALSAAECELLGLATGQAFRLAIRLGRQHLTLLQFMPEGSDYPADSTSTDLWFQHCAIVVADMRRASDRVTGAGAVPISDGPQHLPENTGGVTAFKFRDPFGQPLELLYLPPHVGDPGWHRTDPPLFLGMDHTAITVSDAAASLRFYADALGLNVGERTLNQGPAQARLDAVAGDRVDVVALAPAESPPHLELLAYRTGTRRPIMASSAADAAVSRTVAAGDVDAVAGRLAQAGHNVRRGCWGDRTAIAFTDPDGHGWICVAD